MKRIFISGNRKKSFMSIMMVMFSISLFTLSVYAEDEDSLKTITITADYSAYCEDTDDLEIVCDAAAYSGTSDESRLDLISRETGDSTMIYQFQLKDNAEEIYVTPPIIAVGEKMEEFRISVSDGIVEECEFFKIDDISCEMIRKFDTVETDNEMVVSVSSETNQYPERLMLVSDGTYYSGVSSVTFSQESDIEEICLQSSAFHYKTVDSEEQMKQILEDAYFSCNEVRTYEYAEKTVFSSLDKITIHAVIPEIKYN